MRSSWSVRAAAALSLSLLAPGRRALAGCDSPPASWGTDWSAYESWCRGCCGTFVRSGTQSRCDPGGNWGCGGSRASGGGGAAAPFVPRTMEGAVLQGIQSGIQQGLRNAAESRRRAQEAAAAARARQQAEENLAEERMREGRESLEKAAKEGSADLEARSKAARQKAKRAEAERAAAAAAGMRGLPSPSPKAPAATAAPAPLKPKDLGAKAPPRPAGPAPALACAAAEAYADLESLGPRGAELARSLREELAAVLADFKDKPPSGKAGAVTTVSVGRDSAAEGAHDGTQAVVSVLLARDEATGGLFLTVQSSVRPPGGSEKASEARVSLDRDGRVRDKDGSPAAEACLDRLAR